MQPQLPFDTPAPHPIVEFVRVRRARRYILRIKPDGTLRVTVPRGGSRSEAAQFAERHRPWVERERLRVLSQHAPPAWDAGTPILLRGIEHTIRVESSGSGRVVNYAERSVRAAATGDIRRVIETDLRRLARAELIPRLEELAAGNGITVGRVLIRNQRSRWGSCSGAGVIALNFRLVQMPADVRDYVLIHELMHRKQQNHSRRFWRLVEAACPAFRDAERWLKTRGRSLF